MALKFEILKKYNKSRLGKLYTKHGIVNTPAFIFRKYTIPFFIIQSSCASARDQLRCQTG